MGSSGICWLVYYERKFQTFSFFSLERGMLADIIALQRSVVNALFFGTVLINV